MTNLTSQLAHLINQVSSLRRFVENGKQKPHKLLLILAVIDLFDTGHVQENVILYDVHLEQAFEKAFLTYAQSGDLCQLTVPFFHMKGSGFWFHKIMDGRQAAYQKIRKMGASTLWITDNIEYAYFSDDAYNVMASALHRKILKDFVLLRLAE